jgi:hypothetical protein
MDVTGLSGELPVEFGNLTRLETMYVAQIGTIRFLLVLSFELGVE